jgi:pimeloyl-ACP methyl ester carboxylesterase
MALTKPWAPQTYPQAQQMKKPQSPVSVSRASCRRFRWMWVASAFIPVLLLSAGFQRVRYDLRSYALLTRFANPQATGPLLSWESRSFSTQDVSIPTTGGSVRARLYLPAGISHPPGIVIVHGIHHLGIDEPRLVNLSRAAAASGFAVLTPEVAALADYRVDASSIATIGESPAWFEQRLGSGPVTVIGVSFAGGLALLAASDPQYAPHMRALVLMGAYDSLARVSQFLASDEAELPDGRWIPYAAHEYGALVLVYSHLDQFFPIADIPVAREALRDLLSEKPEAAQPLFARLSPEARLTMEALFTHQVSHLRAQLLAVIAAARPQLDALSPEGKLGQLRVPVYVLHGASDNVIPPTESEWLAKDVPPRDLRAVLITPAFSHADPQKGVKTYQELRLIDFLGGALRASAGGAP